MFDLKAFSNVLNQRSYTDNKPVIKSSDANAPCSYLVDELLLRLNRIFGTSYIQENLSESLQSTLKSCIERDYDLGTAYARLRPYWFNDASRDINEDKREDQNMRNQLLASNKIVDGDAPPRRVWDLYANRVVPYWVVGKYPWAVSHVWVKDDELKYVRTPINQNEWPVPIPKDANLDLIRIEMLNLGAEYVWLDVLCIRQRLLKRPHTEGLRTRREQAICEQADKDFRDEPRDWQKEQEEERLKHRNQLIRQAIRREDKELSRRLVQVIRERADKVPPQELRKLGEFPQEEEEEEELRGQAIREWANKELLNELSRQFSKEDKELESDKRQARSYHEQSVRVKLHMDIRKGELRKELRDWRMKNLLAWSEFDRRTPGEEEDEEDEEVSELMDEEARNEKCRLEHQKLELLKEKWRLEEWKVDVPTIGWVYRKADRVVCYFGGLGRPLNTVNFEDDRCWFKRAWTLQEMNIDPIIGGGGPDVLAKPRTLRYVPDVHRLLHVDSILLGVDSLLGVDNLLGAHGLQGVSILMEWHTQLELRTQLESVYATQLESLRRMRRDDFVFDILVQMQNRKSTNPVDRIAALVYLFHSEYIPIYDEDQSEEDAWTALLNVTQDWFRADLFFFYPEPGNGKKVWRPSWDQAMKHTVSWRDPSQVMGKIGRRGGEDVDCYRGPYIESAEVRGLDNKFKASDVSAQKTSRRGELHLKDSNGKTHTFKIIVDHTYPIPDGPYALIGSTGFPSTRSALLWVVGKMQDEKFKKISVFSMADDRVGARLQGLKIAEDREVVLW